MKYLMLSINILDITSAPGTTEQTMWKFQYNTNSYLYGYIFDDGYLINYYRWYIWKYIRCNCVFKIKHWLAQ